MQADARVLRTVLSLMGENDRLLKSGRRGLRGHIVAELADIDNEPLVRMVGTDNCGVYTVTRCGGVDACSPPLAPATCGCKLIQRSLCSLAASAQQGMQNAVVQ